LARLVREVEGLDNDFEVQKARARATGQQVAYRMPSLSRSLADFLELNKINVGDDQGRMLLKEQLRVMKDQAPIIHMTFAVEADPTSLAQLVAYLRKEIHPQTLLSIGLQPSLVGGAYVRTPNHVHDFSLRELLASKRGVIAQELDAMLKGVAKA
jgi:G3E family GTPase